MQVRAVLIGAMMAVLPLCPAPAETVTFDLVDGQQAMGVRTGRWQPIKLSTDAPERMVLKVRPRGELRYGTLSLGQGARAQRMVVVDYRAGASALYVDADNNGLISRRNVAPTGEKGIWQMAMRPSGGTDRRTVRFRVGVGGRILLYNVRGCHQGTFPTKEGPRPALLLDMDGDCLYTTTGRDQLCVDANGDGKFSPISERVALRPSVRIGRQEYKLSVTPFGGSAQVTMWDRAPGTLLATIPLKSGALGPSIVTLIRDDGKAVALRTFGEPIELLEGEYRLAGADLQVTDKQGAGWRFPFDGNGTTTLKVEPGKQIEAQLIAPVECRLAVTGELQPEGELCVTPDCYSAEGLKLGDATTGKERRNSMPAIAELIGQDGSAITKGTSGYG